MNGIGEIKNYCQQKVFMNGDNSSTEQEGQMLLRKCIERIANPENKHAICRGLRVEQMRPTERISVSPPGRI